MADTQGVIAQARAQAPVVQQQPVAQPAPQPVQQSTPVTPEVTQPQQGFGGPQYQNGFVQQPIPQVVEPQQQVQQPIASDNSRTREQFEKLTDTNQRLSQQIDTLQQEMRAMQQQRMQNQQQFAPVQQQPQVPQTPQGQGGQQAQQLPKLEDYIEVNPVTGESYVNRDRFNAAMQEVVQRASRAEEMVQNYIKRSEQMELDRNNREAFSAYPQLNPQSSNFDPVFNRQARAMIYDSLLNPQDYGGRPFTFKEAADYVRQQLGQPVAQQAVPTPQVNAQNQVQKEQAAVTTQNIPQHVTQNIDAEAEYNRQVMGTRMGSDEAIAVRLLNATHRIQDIERETAGQYAR